MMDTLSLIHIYTPPDDSIIDVNLEILIEQDDSMINTYSLLAVNDAAPFELSLIHI